MKNRSYLYFILRIGVLLLCSVLLLASCSSSVGGDGGAYDDTPSASNRGVAISIVTGNGANNRAAEAAYSVTVALKASGYSDSQTATVASGGSQTFRFTGVPYETPVTASVVIKSHSLILFSGSQTKELSAADNSMTVDLANQLKNTVSIKAAEIDNLKNIYTYIPGSVPTIIIDGSGFTYANLVTAIGDCSGNVKLNLANTGITQFDSGDLTTLNGLAKVENIQLPPSATVNMQSGANLSKVGSGGDLSLTNSASTLADFCTLITNSNNQALCANAKISITGSDINLSGANQAACNLVSQISVPTGAAITVGNSATAAKISGSNIHLKPSSNASAVVAAISSAENLTVSAITLPSGTAISQQASAAIKSKNVSTVNVSGTVSINVATADASMLSSIVPAAGTSITVCPVGGANYESFITTLAGGSLSNVTLSFNGSGITTVPSVAARPTNITGLTLTGVTRIEGDAFKGWLGLGSQPITIPASVTFIGSHAFDVADGNIFSYPDFTWGNDSGWRTDDGTAISGTPSRTEMQDSSIVHD